MKIRKTIENEINRKKSVKPKSGPLKRSIKLVNFSLARLNRKIRKMQMTNIRNKKEVTTVIPWILKGYKGILL